MQVYICNENVPASARDLRTKPKPDIGPITWCHTSLPEG